MRGIVTLAAALALPESPSAFPHRDLIVFCAFCVVLTTLVVQGSTLRPLMHWLGLHDDGSVERESNLARAATAQAALRVLEHRRSPSADILRGEYQARLQMAASGASAGIASRDDLSLTVLQLQTVSAQHDTLTALRAHHKIGDDAFHVVEEELALLELTADPRVRPSIDDAMSAAADR
jgi:CPA1 family monovalent cation:H+ antiporter